MLWLKGGGEGRRKVMVKKRKETKKGERERRREKERQRETAEMEKLEVKLLVCFNECRFSRVRIERH